MDTKECKCCRKVKSLSDFYVRLDSADGYMRMCKKCKSEDNNARHHAKKAEPEAVEDDGTGWPIPAEAELSVQLLHLHVRRAYGAVPRGASW